MTRIDTDNQERPTEEDQQPARALLVLGPSGFLSLLGLLSVCIRVIRGYSASLSSVVFFLARVISPGLASERLTGEGDQVGYPEVPPTPT
jgi:hypothetical protein